MVNKVVLGVFIFGVSLLFIKSDIFDEKSRPENTVLGLRQARPSAHHLQLPMRETAVDPHHALDLSVPRESASRLNRIKPITKRRLNKYLSMNQVFDDAKYLLKTSQEISLDDKLDLLYNIGIQKLPASLKLIGTEVTPDGKGVVKYLQTQENYTLQQVFDEDGTLKQDWYYLPEKNKWLLKQYDVDGNIISLWVSWDKKNHAAYFQTAEKGYIKIVTTVDEQQETLVLDSNGNIVDSDK